MKIIITIWNPVKMDYNAQSHPIIPIQPANNLLFLIKTILNTQDNLVKLSATVFLITVKTKNA